MMKKICVHSLALLLALCGGCVMNDIPYPVILGEVKEITFEGQKELKIDAAKRLITLVLNDTVDMRAVEVLDITLSSDARSTVKKGDRLDFSTGDKASYTLNDSAYLMTVSTYQDYEWKIAVSQPLGLKVGVDGSVGDAIIDTESRTVLVKVSEESTTLTGIVVRDFCLAPAGATYAPDPYATTNYQEPKEFTVRYFDLEEKWQVIVQQVKVNVATGKVTPWAKFAEVTGDISSSSPLSPVFEYREKSATEWQSVAAVRAGSKISAVLKGLLPNHDYVFRAKLGEEVASEVAFRTEATPEIENMGFEAWALAGKTWFANASASATFWASGNPGVTGVPVNKESNTSRTDDKKEGQFAAKIETIKVPVVILAAGSLFTGDFVTNINKPLDSPKFSRPYSGRPTQITFWYKYAPKIIDVARGKPEELGKMDRCLIYIYLGDWEGTLSSSQLAKEADKSKTPGAIAYGEFVSDQAVGSYTKQTINLTYFDKTKPVKKILLVGTSSIYGDFYTGGEGSTLYWDELSFGWDYVE